MENSPSQSLGNIVEMLPPLLINKYNAINMTYEQQEKNPVT